MEWPDGMILGVAVKDGKRYYARYDRTARRWTRWLKRWQLERIDHAWADHVDCMLANPTKEPADAV
jgi:hypothetical protein